MEKKRIRKPNKERKIEMIHCFCGCGGTLNKYDNRNRIRKGLPGHKKPWISILTKGEKISLKNKGKHYSIATEFKKGNKSWSEGLFGKNNPLWKENKVTPLKKWLRGTKQYINWKKSILERDNYTCQICKVRGGKLCVDHYPKTFAEIIKKHNPKNFEDAFDIKELWNTNNGRTLHDLCHRKSHAKRRAKF